jgi:hypothetical protein
LPSASLPIGSAVNASFNIPAQLTCPANNKAQSSHCANFKEGMSQKSCVVLFSLFILHSVYNRRLIAC